ncbi:hypothetical protein RH728_004414 [Vibrio vulnificus]|nr:hypothetical protein [Vibrio vulnificus]EKA6052417.1 hypothetical protein [Vibrio vulnificus]ELB7646202.1 hypothetical protein [Vibrio vulnificus]
MNPIQKIIQSRLKSLLEISNGFEAIDHGSTKGTLREGLLTKFFKDVIPSQLSISSGIISDASGKVSKQTDFIVFNKSVLPVVFLSEDISVVPLDAVYLTAEIKTTLTTDSLRQVSEARLALNKLRPSSIRESSDEFKIPSVILAFSNEVKKETLIDFLDNQNDLVSICIINSYTLNKTQSGIICEEQKSDLPEYWGTLQFSAYLFNYLNAQVSANNRKPNWDAYVIGADKFAEINGLGIN